MVCYSPLDSAPPEDWALSPSIASMVWRGPACWDDALTCNPLNNILAVTRSAAVSLPSASIAYRRLPFSPSLKKDLGPSLSLSSHSNGIHIKPPVPPRGTLRILDRAGPSKGGVTSSSEQPITVGVLTPLSSWQSTDDPKTVYRLGKWCVVE